MSRAMGKSPGPMVKRARGSGARVSLSGGTTTKEDGVFKGSLNDDGALHGYGQHEHAGKVEQGLHGGATWVSAA